MYPKPDLKIVLLALAAGLPVSSAGRSGDSEQPIHVEADAAELNETTGVGVYRGNVRITQGSMLLTADEVTVVARDRDLQKIIARSDDPDGKSTFRQLTDAGEEITAEAERMEYEPDENRIILLHEAVLRRAANRFAAERIVYHIDRQVVDAGDPRGEARVEMTLVPKDAEQAAEGR
jgi:lipopolysaccharide export system protein LptA